jgi:hypothetical protein
VNPTFAPMMDILPAAQRKLWPELRPAVDRGFVLFGGTAIALQIGHRGSVDFDFFSVKPLDRNDLLASFSFMKQSTVLQDTSDTLSVLVPYGASEQDHVKVSFFGSIDNGRVGEPLLTKDGVMKVATLDDLMATKVKTILQRVEAKDYRDIAAMAVAGVSLSKGLAAARKLYGPNFQPSESLKAMVFFEGGDLNTLTRNEKKTLVDVVGSVRELPSIEIIGQEQKKARPILKKRRSAERSR